MHAWLRRDGMPQDQAVQLYTGSHWRVEAATLADVEHFTKFAVSLSPPSADDSLHAAPSYTHGSQSCVLSPEQWPCPSLPYHPQSESAASHVQDPQCRQNRQYKLDRGYSHCRWESTATEAATPAASGASLPGALSRAAAKSSASSRGTSSTSESPLLQSSTPPGVPARNL